MFYMLNVLDIHFRDGTIRTIENVDHCAIFNGMMSGFDLYGYMVVRWPTIDVDHVEVRPAYPDYPARKTATPAMKFGFWEIC